MGLIYVSSESSDFMSALKSNLESGKETVSQLKSGSQKVVSAVDGKQLSGAAYTAGKGLFADLVIPTITRTTNAIEQIEQELKKYQNADKIVASEGELNEDKLNQQIQVTRTMKNSVDQTLFFVRLQTTLNPIASVLDTLLNVQRDLERMTDSFQQDIDHLQNQLRKLQDFNTQTSGLFANSLNELKIAMQGVLILNNTTIKSDGSYSLPKGTNKSYFEKIKKDVSLVIESGDQEIELIKGTDSLEEINRKTIACANIGINPYTGKKISQEEAKKFKYAAWSGTLTNIGDTVMGAYYGNKGASRIDGMDDVGSVKKKSNSESTGGATQKVISEFKSPVLDGKRVGGGTTVDDIKPIWGKDPLDKPIIDKEFPHVPKEHGFSNIVDNYPTIANEYSLVGGDGISRRFFQIEGSNNGKIGVFEWIVEPNGNISHRRFINGGTLTGKPNQVPKK